MTLRRLIAAVMLGSVLLYLALGEHKGIALLVSVPVVLICRVLVIERRPHPNRRPRDEDDDSA